MSWQLARWSTLGVFLGLLISTTNGCAKKCGPDTCSTGCCSNANECVTATSNSACGSAGASCSSCSGTDFCQQGGCVPLGTLADGGRPDAGEVDAGPAKCMTDFDCRALNNGSICDARTGECAVGPGCTADYNCQSLDPANKCYRYGHQCLCDQHDGPAGYTGTCRLRKSPCEECTADVECGSDNIVFGPPDGIGRGVCKALPDDTSGKKYCRYVRVGQCACGTVDDGSGFCIPQSHSCSQVGCNADKDCGANSVCTVSNADAGASSCGGVCVPRCRWDFLTQSNVAPGCPQGQTCWVDSANLDPASPYFGSGRCRPACQSESDCAKSASNPFGGSNLTCAAEVVAGGTSDKRCRAKGQCMDSSECPDLPLDSPYLGYCDRATFACKSDCRTGTDPVTSNPFKDCKYSYSCAANGSVNECKVQSCMQQGGASIACTKGQYCCSEDKNGDGVADPCPPVVDAVGCYDAPKPPFCVTCKDDTECASPAVPGWLTCKNPACSPLPNKCYDVGDGKGGSLKMCVMATFNDNSFNVNNTPKTALGCPTGYSPNFLATAPNPMDTDLCQTNDDCNVGTDAGRCEKSPALRLPDGGSQKACVCTGGSGTSQCPTGSQCHTAVKGQPIYCIDSVVCLPGGLVNKSVDAGGCGL